MWSAGTYRGLPFEYGYTVNFEKQGLGVTSIGKNSASCTIKATYNGEKQATSCAVEIPTIAVEEGYTSLGWSTNKNATTGSNVSVTGPFALYCLITISVAAGAVAVATAPSVKISGKFSLNVPFAKQTIPSAKSTNTSAAPACNKVIVIIVTKTNDDALFVKNELEKLL